MLHHLDTGPLSFNLFSDATSTQQLLMTVRLYYIIDICPEKNLIRVDLDLSRKVSTYIQYITIVVKESIKLDQENSYSLSKRDL